MGFNKGIEPIVSYLAASEHQHFQEASSFYFWDKNLQINIFQKMKVDSRKDNLNQLRKLMVSNQPSLAAYIIPSCDAHNSEYISACDERRAFITGFDGSAGTGNKI